MKQTRQPYEAEWREIASLAQPARSRWLNSDTNKNVRQRNRSLNSSHGITSFRKLQGGMTAGLSSPSSPFFTLTTYDQELNEDPEVKAWLGECERLLYVFLALTNFYDAVKSGYLEMGLFGTEACVMLPGRPGSPEPAVCYALTAGEYWIANGADLKPAALYRRCPMTSLQALQQFDKKMLRPQIIAAYDRSDYTTIFNFYQAIEVNDEREPGMADKRGMPWRSCYWDDDDGRDGDEFVQWKGSEEQPFWAPRWDTVGSDAWGTGPGHVALPDLRELQLHVKRYGEAEDLSIWPEIIVPSKIRLKRQPKSVVSAAEMDISKVLVPYTIQPGTLEKIDARIVLSEAKVDAASHADLFMAISTMQGSNYKNVEEIASRNEEKMTQLGSVIERVNNEKLEVALDRAFGIMQRSGWFPPPPDSIEDGAEVKPEFTSILTQMQKMVKLGQIERGAGFFATQMSVFPGIRHKIDEFEMVDEYAHRLGMPPKIIRTTKDAMALAEQEAEAQAAAQNAEAMSKMAPAGKVAVDAAALAADPALQGFADPSMPIL